MCRALSVLSGPLDYGIWSVPIFLFDQGAGSRYGSEDPIGMDMEDVCAYLCRLRTLTLAGIASLETSSVRCRRPQTHEREPKPQQLATAPNLRGNGSFADEIKTCMQYT